MYKMAVMGDYDSIYGFSTLGLEIFPVEDVALAAKKLHRLAKEYGVIFVTEGLASKIWGEIETFEDRVTPAVILIPGIAENTGEGMNVVRRTIEKAIGSDVLFSTSGNRREPPEEGRRDDGIEN